MNFITQLLPGVRDIRGPLVAGYLWLFSGWLLLADYLPSRNTNVDAYTNVIEVGDSLGRVGIVAAVSVAAYLVGSLLQTIPSWLSGGFRVIRRFLESQAILAKLSGVMVFSPLDASAILYKEPVFSPEKFRWIDGDEQTKHALRSLVEDRLNQCRRELGAALNTATDEVDDGVKLGEPPLLGGGIATAAIGVFGDSEDGWRAAQWVAQVGDCKKTAPVHGHLPSLPSFSAARDLFRERSTIVTRLMETTQHAGSEVERLYAESEFRFTVALPLAVLAVVLSAESGDLWWLGLVGFAIGLVVHSIVLRKRGGRELVEALRSRPEHEELDQVTPVFTRYSHNATKLTSAVSDVDWNALGAAIRRDSE